MVRKKSQPCISDYSCQYRREKDSHRTIIHPVFEAETRYWFLPKMQVLVTK